MSKSIIKNESYFINKGSRVLNNEGFGFYDTYSMLGYIDEPPSLLGEHFFNGEYKEMLNVIKKNDNLKISAKNTYLIYLRIKLPFNIEDEPKYIRLNFYNPGGWHYYQDPEDNLINVLKQMIKIKENNLLTYMKQQPSIIYAIHKEDDDVVDGFEKHRIVFNETESINFFDLLPIIRIKDPRNTNIHSNIKNPQTKVYHLPLFVNKLDRNINIPPRFAKYMNDIQKYAMFTYVEDKKVQYNIEVGSVLTDSNLILEGSRLDSDNTFISVLKEILNYIKKYDNMDYIKKYDDVLNNFIDLLLVMSINQINYTRHIQKGPLLQYNNTNFLNWYYYIEVERQIEKVTKKHSNFFYKLYYGNFFTLDLVDKKIINVIYPFYFEVMLLLLDEIYGYKFKNFFDEAIMGNKGVNLELENNLKRIDYIKLIYFFEKIVKKDEEKKNEEFPYNHFRKNNPDLRKNFEDFAKIKLKEKNIEFSIEFKRDEEEDDDIDKKEKETKLKLIPDSDSDSE